MGMFDTLLIKCPKCRETVAFQSKAGPCDLMDYRYGLDDVPLPILADMDGQQEPCPKCHTILVPQVCLTMQITTKS